MLAWEDCKGNRASERSASNTVLEPAKLYEPQVDIFLQQCSNSKHSLLYIAACS